MMNINDGENFLQIKSSSITIWGIDITPFNIQRTKEINDYILKYDFYNEEVCEIIEDDVVGLFYLCTKEKINSFF